MKCWNYRSGSPWIPVTLFGETIIDDWAFVDTGAGYYVLHPKFIDVLKLKPEREEGLHGFGSKEPVKTKITSLESH